MIMYFKANLKEGMSGAGYLFIGAVLRFCFEASDFVISVHSGTLFGVEMIISNFVLGVIFFIHSPTSSYFANPEIGVRFSAITGRISIVSKISTLSK